VKNTTAVLAAAALLTMTIGATGVARAATAVAPASAEAQAEAEAAKAEKADLDAQLADARRQLEDAARQVAEISSRMAKPYIDDFMYMGAEGPPRAAIGVQLDPHSGKDGAVIQEVSPGGPAADAGIHAGDIIVAVNGNDVKGNKPVREVLHQVAKLEPESKVKLTVIRDGKPREFTVTTRPGATYFYDMNIPRPPRPPRPPEPPAPPGAPDMSFDFKDFNFGPRMIHGPMGELELVSLTPQLGSYFGTDKGVLVVRAPKEAGFKLEDGDVILAIDGREPTSGSHATRILSSYQPGEKISMKVMRQHKSLNIETSLPERRGPGARAAMDGKPRADHRETGGATT
jgi:C-terminal processing protease CtpA/Prc